MTSDEDIQPAETLLRDKWGFSSFRDGQREAIGKLLAGHSVAAVFPTGGGKSLCYQLPALLFDGLTLVVSPLIALMKDQIDALAARGVRARRIDSSLRPDELSAVMGEVRAGSLKLLYVAPERFNNERFRRSLVDVKLSLFAVDEAHCISEWGHNFRPDYLKLVRFAREHGAERVLALTATATPAVLTDICQQFEIAPDNAVRTPFYRENLALMRTATNASGRDDLLLKRLRERPAGPTIVYVTRQQTAEETASLLARAGFNAVPYHAGMKTEQRSHVQEGFMRGSIDVVVATIAFGMGVDKADIRYVYHYNLPKSMESYSQEIGRAGRDGEPSICEVLACADDIVSLENFAYGDTPDPDAVQSLVASVFRLVDPGDRFDVSFFDLASTHDVRPLVVRTLLTYLELDGYLESGTPFYQSYRFKALMSSREILASYEEPTRRFLRSLLALSVKARTWFTIDVEAAIAQLAAPRAKVVGALDDLHEQGFIELQSSGVRHTFVLHKQPLSVADLATDLFERALAREKRELDRLANVFALIASADCQASRLGAHFGEPLDAPCGHCSACAEQSGIDITAAAPRDQHVDPQVLANVRTLANEDPKNLRALSTPRAIARFLCGISSPLTARARITRHPLFGSLAKHRFSTVLGAAMQS